MTTKKIAAFFREYEKTSIAPANFFGPDNPNEIAEALGKFTPGVFEEISDENDGSIQLGYFLASHPELTIRSLIILNAWRRDCNVTDNSFIGEDTFTDGMSPAEEAFMGMSLGDQINAFLAIGIPEDPWQVSDTIRLSEHIKLEDYAAEIRDHVLEYNDSLRDAEPSPSSLLKIIIVLLTDEMKEITLRSLPTR